MEAFHPGWNFATRQILLKPLGRKLTMVAQQFSSLKEFALGKSRGPG